MTQGLVMFDRDGRLAVHNDRFVEMIGIPAGTKLVGATLRDISRKSAEADPSAPPESAGQRAEAIHARMMTVAGAEGGGEVVFDTPSGRSIRAIHSPLADGSWVTTIEDITDNRRLGAELAEISVLDALTGLPNRPRFVSLLNTSIDQIGSSGRSIAVVLFDIDAFGEINDALGTDVGDDVLKAMVDRVRAGSRVGELLGRLGGDEFAFLKSMNSPAELEEFLPRVIKTIGAPFDAEGRPVSLTVRMGVAIYPNDAVQGGKLFANADLALARAKQDLPGSVCLYNPTLDEMSRQRRDLAHELASGLGSDQFFVAFQVQNSVQSGEVTGYEALLRWRHPRLGMIPPSEFIPLAEQSGQIAAVGRWVLERACRDAMEAGLEGRIAVNVSPLQLSDGTLVESVADILNRTGMSPGRLELEVTETGLVAGKAEALEALHQLKNVGISIALDDFGTGYSSLETLRVFPFDKIKLDRSFVVEIETSETARAILRAVIALGKALNTPILAEGIETEEQLERLRRKGCDLAQGYYFGRPMAIAHYMPGGDQARSAA